jgi:hypothetical protein
LQALGQGPLSARGSDEWAPVSRTLESYESAAVIDTLTGCTRSVTTDLNWLYALMRGVRGRIDATW